VRLIDELRAEHEVIEKVLGSLRTYAERRARGEGTPADGEGFLGFFRLYAGSWHHAREEDTLFPALVKHLELAPHSGPIFSLIDQHHRMAATLDEMATLLCRDGLSTDEREKLVEVATRYSRALLLHIDAENSVLLPESEERLRRTGVHELPGRGATAEELAALAEGERLAAHYPPVHDPGALRGDGCFVCPSHGTTCRGLEREWWTDDEWEAFGRIAER
jgi:hemerythrin-like domain-containing protein